MFIITRGYCDMVAYIFDFVCSSRAPLLTYSLTLIPAYISNYMPSKVWDEITNPFPEFNGSTGEVWEWISNIIPFLKINEVIIFPFWSLKNGCWSPAPFQCQNTNISFYFASNNTTSERLPNEKTAGSTPLGYTGVSYQTLWVSATGPIKGKLQRLLRINTDRNLQLLDAKLRILEYKT